MDATLCLASSKLNSFFFFNKLNSYSYPQFKLSFHKLVSLQTFLKMERFILCSLCLEMSRVPSKKLLGLECNVNCNCTHSLGVRLWANSLTPLCLSVLKTDTREYHLPRVIMGLNKAIYWKTSAIHRAKRVGLYGLVIRKTPFFVHVSSALSLWWWDCPGMYCLECVPHTMPYDCC